LIIIGKAGELRNAPSWFIVACLILSLFVYANTNHLARAQSGTIYINSDGSITRSIARILRSGDLYTFTSDINGPIIVQKDNILIDGLGHTLGGGSSKGIDLTGRTNVTVQNIRIEGFDYGVWLTSHANHNFILGNNITRNNVAGIWLGGSSDNTISDNNINNNTVGIWLFSSSNNNSVYRNSISANVEIGIETYMSTNNRISNNTVTSNSYGIEFDGGSGNFVSGNNVRGNGAGIYPGDSSADTISGNNVTNNGDGIFLFQSLSCTLSENNITGNVYGFFFVSSSHNRLVGNVITNNSQNFGVEGFGLSHFVNYADTSNFVDGKTVYYLVNNHDVTIPSDAGYVAIANCTRITIQNLTLTSNYQGLLLAYTTNSTISKNNITANSRIGIDIISSSHNTISGNSITKNQDGISLIHSSENTFCHNNFINNTKQVLSDGSPNGWDDGYPSGGNYWSDYGGVDIHCGEHQNRTGSDGIGDTPYVMDANNTDHYPFMTPNGWENHPISIKSNVTVTTNAIGKTSLCFTASGPTGQTGYIDATMPIGFNTTAIRVFLDAEPVQPPFPVITTNDTHYSIYFEFKLGTHQIAILYAPSVRGSVGITGYKLLFNETLGNPFNSMANIDYYWNFSVQKWNGTQWLASGTSASSTPVTGYSLLALTTVNLPYYTFLLPRSGPNAVREGDWLKVSYTFNWTYNSTNYSTNYVEKLHVHPADTSGNATVAPPYFGADGKVSTSDLTLLAKYWGKSIAWTGTFNPTDDLHRADTGMYGKVSTGDLTILATNWGSKGTWNNTPPPG
jgi:parallel beta-helix repeat protein